MGRGTKRNRGGGDFEDQYGEANISQDREGRASASGRGSGSHTGGGSAGAGRKDREVNLVRSVPKFLQGHIHLLGRKPQNDEVEQEAELSSIEQHRDIVDEDEADKQEALQKSILENPALATEHPELQSLADKAVAAQAKEAGNIAFAAKKYEAAAQYFTEALRFQKNIVFYSNRAAAYHALRRYQDAISDAKQVIALDSKWVKGWSRLAAAHFALEEWSEAKDAYENAVRLEPSDHALQAMLHRAEISEAKEETDKVVKFKQSRRLARAPPEGTKSAEAAANRTKGVLSFSENEDL